MKKSLLALSLGLAAGIAGTSAFANTGHINFEGQITASTCPIEIVNPVDGSIGNQVKMGSIDASRFTATGQELSGNSFTLRVKDGAACGIVAGNKGSVTFNGTPDSSGSYFAVTPGADGAKNLAIVLRDKSGASIAPGSASAEYDLNVTGPTDMAFNAYYRSTAASVIAGVASARIDFVVDIR